MRRVQLRQLILSNNMTNQAQHPLHPLLKTVIEPLRKKDIVSLGMIKCIDEDNEKLTVTLKLPSPVYKDSSLLETQVIETLKPHTTKKVTTQLLIETLSGHRGLPTRLPDVKNVIAVAAGKGGVGKSTVAVNLALGLHLQGAKVGLLDADIYGPSIPTMLGPPDIAPGALPDNKISPAVHFGIKVISIGFFTERQGAAIFRGPIVHKLLEQFLQDVFWGELDYLIIDLPPGTGDTQLSLSQLIPITGALIVTTPQEVALIDVEKAVSMFKKVEIPLLGVIENMSYHTCSACGHHDEIFSRGGGKSLADSLKTNFLGEIPIDGRIRYGGDIGRPVVIGNKNGEHTKRFLDIANLVSETIIQQAPIGPKRPKGLVQIR